MTGDAGEDTGQKQSYDLEERTARFGQDVIAFAKTLSRSTINEVLIKQLVRSGTSIGANYCEADDAESRKDFRHKVGLCKKESRETKHWFRMIATAEPTRRSEVVVLWREAKELHLIFTSIRRSIDAG
ncbi:MAG: four helix bundle protein [Phycisphaeraceae bacterium]|nr:four helix bundle protein [Phycisphaeraceae bacterium]